MQLSSTKTLPFKRRCAKHTTDDEFKDDLEKHGFSRKKLMLKLMERNFRRLVDKCSDLTQEEDKATTRSKQLLIHKLDSKAPLSSSVLSTNHPLAQSMVSWVSQEKQRREDEQIKSDKEIYDSITVLQKHLIPTKLLKRIYYAEHKETNNNVEFQMSLLTPQGPLLYRESSLKKLNENDTSKYEESMKDLMQEYRDFTKKSDLVSSRKFKFKKFIPQL